MNCVFVVVCTSFDRDDVHANSFIERVSFAACSRAFSPVVQRLYEERHDGTAFDPTTSFANGAPIDSIATLRSIVVASQATTTSAFVANVVSESARVVASFHPGADPSLLSARELHLNRAFFVRMCVLLTSIRSDERFFCCIVDNTRNIADRELAELFVPQLRRLPSLCRRYVDEMLALAGVCHRKTRRLACCVILRSMFPPELVPMDKAAIEVLHPLYASGWPAFFGVLRRCSVVCSFNKHPVIVRCF